MKIGEYFKKYNIRVSNINPVKKNLSIFNTSLNTKTFKNFSDLKRFFEQKKIAVRHFYIPDQGTIPFYLEIKKINNFIKYQKQKLTIEGKLDDTFKILNNHEYYDVDWFLRSMENLLLQIKEKNFFQLRKFLKVLKNNDLSIFKKTINLINNLKANNIVLKEFKT